VDRASEDAEAAAQHGTCEIRTHYTETVSAWTSLGPSGTPLSDSRFVKAYGPDVAVSNLQPGN